MQTNADYDDYYERSLLLVRPGGLTAINNTLWSGNVADPTVADPQTQALRDLNQKLHADIALISTSSPSVMGWH